MFIFLKKNRFDYNFYHYNTYLFSQVNLKIFITDPINVIKYMQIRVMNL